MIHCPTCGYAWNPDSAVNCGQCKNPLRAPNAPVSSDTLRENARSQSDSGGSGTPVGQTPTASNPSNSAAASNYVAPQTPRQPLPDQFRSDATRYYPVRPETPPEAPPVSSARPSSADSAQNRKTAVADETPSRKNAPTAPNESAGQQTVALGPRRIVGVLITYSWRDEGQIFPVLRRDAISLGKILLNAISAFRRTLLFLRLTHFITLSAAVCYRRQGQHERHRC